MDVSGMYGTAVKRALAIGGLALLTWFGTLYGMYRYGQHRAEKVTWYSELAGKVHNGQKSYLIDAEVVCSNGKDIGRLQVDLNLTNGKLRIVRNDSQLEPNCEK